MTTKITAKLNFYIEFYLLIAVSIIIPVFLLFVMPNMIPQSYVSVSANGDVETKRLSTVPLTTDEVVNTFVKNAVLYSLSFTADDLEGSREKARPYYSESAFNTDFQAIENERINLINNSDVLIARVTIPDELILLGTRNYLDRKVWRFYAEPLVVYEGQGGTSETRLNVVVILSQTSGNENISGIAIDKIEIR